MPPRTTRRPAEALLRQQARGLPRADLGAADQHHAVLAPGVQFGGARRQFAQRQVDRAGDVAGFAIEVLGFAYVDHGDAAPGLQCAQHLRGDHQAGLELAYQARQEHQRRRHRQCQHAVADRVGVAGQRRAPGMAQPGIGQRAGQHAHGGGQRIGGERNARQAQGVIHHIEGEQRHQADEGDEAPALGLDAFDQLLEASAGPLRDPVAGQVARDEEGQHGAQRCPGEAVERTGKNAEQRAGGEGQYRSGQEQHGARGIQRDEGDRGPPARRWPASAAARPARRPRGWRRPAPGRRPGRRSARRVPA
jgi:hypothetical protein